MLERELEETISDSKACRAYPRRVHAWQEGRQMVLTKSRHHIFSPSLLLASATASSACVFVSYLSCTSWSLPSLSLKGTVVDGAQPDAGLVQSEQIFDEVSKVYSSFRDVEESQSTTIAAVTRVPVGVFGFCSKGISGHTM